MKKILVPTDFSHEAATALDYALAFAKEISAEVDILHVMQMPMLFSGINEEDAIIKLKKIKKKIQEDPAVKNIKCNVHFKRGHIIHHIRDFVKEHNTDWIVMGTRGGNIIQETFIGSITKGVIHTVQCPVLAVPHNSEFQKPDKILLAVDFFGINDYTVLNPLKDVAKLFNAEIQIFNIMTNPEPQHLNTIQKVTAELENYFKPVRCSFHFAKDHDVVEAIIEFLLEEDIYLFALVTREYNVGEKVFYKSISDKMALHTAVPLLVLHDKSVSKYISDESLYETDKTDKNFNSKKAS